MTGEREVGRAVYHFSAALLVAILSLFLIDALKPRWWLVLSIPVFIAVLGILRGRDLSK